MALQITASIRRARDKAREVARRLRPAFIMLALAVVIFGSARLWFIYRHGAAPASWIAASVRDVDDPMVRQDVRTALAKRAARGEIVSRTIVENEVENQRASARQQRAAQAQKGALR